MTRFHFTDEQLLFRDAVRDLLQKECTPQTVRELWESDTARSPQLWAALAEMGVVGLLVPEEHGGLGLDERDLVLLLEEAGRAALPAPLLETTAVAVPLLRDHAPAEVAAAWLPRVAAGTAVLTIRLDPSPFVPDAHIADLLLLQRGDDVVAVSREVATLTGQPSVDGSRRLFAVEVEADTGTTVGGADAVAAAFDRGALAAAAQLVGLAQHLLDTTVAYATQRQQFGQPIGSFQAVKHHLANAVLGIEFARPLVHRAASSVAQGHPKAPSHVSMAKSAASDAASATARTALQVHGAIGYAFEYDLQLWMKRVWVLAAAWGDAGWHRRRLQEVLLTTRQD